MTSSTGRVFSKKKVGMKDIEANRDLIEAVVQVSKGTGRYSTCVLAKAILQHYTKHRLFPLGLTSDMECAVNWSRKQAFGVLKCVSRFTRLMRGAPGAKNKVIREMKESLLDSVEAWIDKIRFAVPPSYFAAVSWLSGLRGI